MDFVFELCIYIQLLLNMPNKFDFIAAYSFFYNDILDVHHTLNISSTLIYYSDNCRGQNKNLVCVEFIASQPQGTATIKLNMLSW